MSGTGQPGPTGPPYPTSPQPPTQPTPGWTPDPATRYVEYRRRHPIKTSVKVVAVIVVVGLVLLVGYLAAVGLGVVNLPRPRPTVDVTQVEWLDQHDNILGTGPGAVIKGNGVLTESIGLTYKGCFLFCGSSETITMGAVVGVDNNGSSSAPWTYVSSNLPLVIPAGQSGTVAVTIEAPDVTFNGVVGISLTITS